MMLKFVRFARTGDWGCGGYAGIIIVTFETSSRVAVDGGRLPKAWTLRGSYSR